jgi:hypothetical protein
MPAATAQSKMILKRLAAIEDRLASIEKMLGDLLEAQNGSKTGKRGTQNVSKTTR